jgi:hypothetical protein
MSWILLTLKPKLSEQTPHAVSSGFRCTRQRCKKAAAPERPPLAIRARLFNNEEFAVSVEMQEGQAAVIAK